MGKQVHKLLIIVKKECGEKQRGREGRSVQYELVGKGQFRTYLS